MPIYNVKLCDKYPWSKRTQKFNTYTIIAKNDNVLSRYIANNEKIFKELMYCYIQHYGDFYDISNYICHEPKKHPRTSDQCVFDIVFKPHLKTEDIIDSVLLKDYLTNTICADVLNLLNGYPIDNINWKLFNLTELKKYFLSVPFCEYNFCTYINISVSSEDNVIICPVEDKYNDVEERIEYLRKDHE